MFEKEVYRIRQNKFHKFNFTVHQYPNAIGLWRNEQEALLWLGLNADPKGDFIEIGSFCGGSAVLLCLAKEFHGPGDTKVYSADRNFKLDFDKADTLARSMFMKNTSGFNFSSMIRKESTELADYLKDNPPKNKISFAFIDGWHSFKGALLDFQTVLPYLADDAIIAVHDTWQQPYSEEQLKKASDKAKMFYNEWMKEELPAFGGESQTYNLDEVVAYLIDNYNCEYVKNPMLDGTQNCLAAVRRIK